MMFEEACTTASNRAIRERRGPHLGAAAHEAAPAQDPLAVGPAKPIRFVVRSARGIHRRPGRQDPEQLAGHANARPRASFPSLAWGLHGLKPSFRNRSYESKRGLSTREHE